MKASQLETKMLPLTILVRNLTMDTHHQTTMPPKQQATMRMLQTLPFKPQTTTCSMLSTSLPKLRKTRRLRMRTMRQSTTRLQTMRPPPYL